MNTIERISVTDQVIKELKGLITNEEYTIGDKLPSEMELCKTLNVSRSTIREAFRFLQAMDYVEIRSGKGAFIKNISPSSPDSIKIWFKENAIKLNSFIEVRLAIESLAVKVAIERSTENEITELEKIEEKFEESVAHKSVVDMARFDEAFHEKIVVMTKNELLIHLNRLVADEFRGYRSKSFAVEAHMEHPIEPHRKICEAFRNRNPKMGLAFLEMHLDQSKNDISRVIEE